MPTMVIPKPREILPFLISLPDEVGVAFAIALVDLDDSDPPFVIIADVLVVVDGPYGPTQSVAHFPAEDSFVFVQRYRLGSTHSWRYDDSRPIINLAVKAVPSSQTSSLSVVTAWPPKPVLSVSAYLVVATASPERPMLTNCESNCFCCWASKDAMLTFSPRYDVVYLKLVLVQLGGFSIVIGT